MRLLRTFLFVEMRVGWRRSERGLSGRRVSRGAAFLVHRVRTPVPPGSEVRGQGLAAALQELILPLKGQLEVTKGRRTWRGQQLP